MNTEVQDLPLLELFDRLRAAGLPLGIDEYHLLLRALQRGYGLPDPVALAHLCCALWASSREEAAVVRFHFYEVITRPPARPTLAVPVPVSPTDSLGAPERPLVLSLAPDLTAYEDPSEVANPDMVAPPEEEVTSSMLPGVDLQVPAPGDEVPRSTALLGDDEYPVTRRQMKQVWRHLRRPVREGPPAELDIEATITQTGRLGVLLGPVLVPRRINRVTLLVLADQHGSMAPFHDLTRRLCQTARRGGRLGMTGVYYFHNAPQEVLYHDPALADSIHLADFSRGLRPERTAVLIFSDAGAARGSRQNERVQLTESFLAQLRQHVRRIAWLNPVPQVQWDGTSAAAIARLVPMFELTRHGLQSAVDALRGRTTIQRG